jgi:hypothetical protein
MMKGVMRGRVRSRNEQESRRASFYAEIWVSADVRIDHERLENAVEGRFDEGREEMIELCGPSVHRRLLGRLWDRRGESVK